MRPSSDEFGAYLAPGETVVAGTPGILFDDSVRSEGAVAVTDRRVLFVSERGGFVDVAHEAISSIRGRPRRGFTYRGMGPALLAVLGGGLAVAAFIAVLVVEPGPLAFLLLAATVGGVAIAERVRRRGLEVEWRVLDDAKTALAGALSTVESDRGPLSALRGPLAGAGGRVDPDLLVLGVVTVALTSMIGLIAVTERLLVVPLVLATIVGAALAEYGYRRQRERDALGADRSLGRDVSIHLVDGRVVHLRVDAGVGFDRELSAAVRESVPPTATAEPSRP